jgi:hypothetical protein
MKLEKGTFARVLVLAEWHSHLVAHQWVKPSDPQGGTVEVIVEVVDSDGAGIWGIDHFPGKQSMEDGSLLDSMACCHFNR